MRYAFAEFDRDGNMVPALYCKNCAQVIAQAVGGRWDAVILWEDEDFVCDGCHTTEAPSCDVAVSRQVIDRDLQDIRA